MDTMTDDRRKYIIKTHWFYVWKVNALIPIERWHGTLEECQARLRIAERNYSPRYEYNIYIVKDNQ